MNIALERLRCKMTDREEFKKWYKTTNKGELSRFEIWQARGELDAVRIKELEAKLDKVKRTLFFEQRWHATIQACKEALEQRTNMVTIPLDKLEDMQRRLKEQPTAEQSSLVQEPVAYFKKWEDKSGEHKDIKFSNSEGYKPLYTQPAPRPTQEPVAWMHCVDEDITEFNDFQACPKCEPLYTHPKEWQGLSDDEIDRIYCEVSDNCVKYFPSELYAAWFKALKEKNG